MMNLNKLIEKIIDVTSLQIYELMGVLLNEDVELNIPDDSATEMTESNEEEVKDQSKKESLYIDTINSSHVRINIY